jgi:glyoxylase-like metal-dependent hydrolase (beta-lactamase superfamily II)/8-oxo-dGTP pyrophosphatase MutT (NUDIX family)
MTPALRPAASIIAISRGGPLRLLWVRRSEANPFLGGFHSFPGGRVAREDGPPDNDGGDSEAAVRTAIRCTARETFEETGLLLGFTGKRPPQAEQEEVRREVLAGRIEFWSSVEKWGLAFDPSRYVACGRWITPHFSRMRFSTHFFLFEFGADEERDGAPPEPDVWPGELESGGWIDPREALRLWEEGKIVLAMPTLHTIRVLAEGSHDLPRRLHGIPEANGVPSRYVEVRPGITMIPLKTETLAPATHTNAVVVGDGSVLIIDPGSADPEELEGLHGVVERALDGGGRVEAILLTHRHKDHLAGVDAVRARYRAPVWAHPLAADRVSVDRALREGDILDVKGRHPLRLRVLEAPGHSRSHLVFFEEASRTAIVGDVVSGLGTVVIAPPDGNMADYVASLERLRGLEAVVLIPGHGAPHRGVDRLLAALLEHRRLREGMVLRALDGGPLDADALRVRVYSDTPDAAPELAAKTLGAHLEKLTAEGRVKLRGDRWEVVR